MIIGKLNFMTKIKYGIESKTKWMKNHMGGGGGGTRRVGQDHQCQIRHLWESSQERSLNVLPSFKHL